MLSPQVQAGMPETGVPMINKKKVKVCSAYAETVLNGMAMTMSARPAEGTQRARSFGSLQIDGSEKQSKISRVAPSGRLTAERSDVGDVPLGFIPISSTIAVDEMLGNRGQGTRECPIIGGDALCRVPVNGGAALQDGYLTAANAATTMIEDMRDFGPLISIIRGAGRSKHPPISHNP
ncbi:MAG: hypothetical protein VYB00_04660 [Candidatus Thermoplasmatota archaeon]|nr:hypothetical protein [Candidatus Thermoplasmatota archaeon]